jgi:hypothetical protein
VEEPNGRKNRGRVVAEKKNIKRTTGRQEKRASEPPSPRPPLLNSTELDQIHAAVSSDGFPNVAAASRGHGGPVPLCLDTDLLLRQRPTMCHHGVAPGRKRRPVPEAEAVGKEGLEGGGGVP